MTDDILVPMYDVLIVDPEVGDVLEASLEGLSCISRTTVEEARLELGEKRFRVVIVRHGPRVPKKLLHDATLLTLAAPTFEVTPADLTIPCSPRAIALAIMPALGHAFMPAAPLWKLGSHELLLDARGLAVAQLQACWGWNVEQALAVHAQLACTTTDEIVAALDTHHAVRTSAGAVAGYLRRAAEAASRALGRTISPQEMKTWILNRLLDVR